jgi:hypothetical protein
MARCPAVQPGWGRAEALIIGIGHIELAVVAAQAAGLSQGRLGVHIIDEILAAAAGKGPQVSCGQVHTPDLMHPGHGEVEVLALPM